jgi:hypothetical protein
MAKTYLEATTALNGHSPDVIIIDEAGSIGGTWARERIYKGLKTNNIAGSYEFSDFPMDLERYSLKPGQHIPGLTVHRYLSDFADHFDLTSRIRLRTKVEGATMLQDATWLIEYTQHAASGTTPPPPTTGKLTAKKLVLATGLTSTPHIPQLPGQANFTRPILHSKQLRELLVPDRDDDDDASDPAPDNTGAAAPTGPAVVVLGGNKSAWDACYGVATRRRQTAHMVMRPSGGGPSWVWRPLQVDAPGGHRVRLTLSRLSLTRACTWFDPWPFAHDGGLVRWFLHRTLLGRQVCGLFWGFLDQRICRGNGYGDCGDGDGDDDDGGGKSHNAVAMMRPWTSTCWMGNSLSIHNYETDWFQLVREGRIVPHIADVEELDGGIVKLSDGSSIEVDALVACTGWKSFPTMKFEPEDVHHELEQVLVERRSSCLNRTASLDGTSFPEFHDESSAEGRAQVLTLRPELRSKPIRILPIGKNVRSNTIKSEREEPGPSLSGLYRFIVPPSRTFLENRNLAVIGGHISIHTVMLAQAQALWITAFFHGRVASTATANVDAVRQEALVFSEYERIRRPREAGGCGRRFPDLVFDSFPYMNMLLEELGIATRRKPSWIREMLQPYTLSDYRGLVSEWLRREAEKVTS